MTDKTNEKDVGSQESQQINDQDINDSKVLKADGATGTEFITEKEDKLPPFLETKYKVDVEYVAHAFLNTLGSDGSRVCTLRDTFETLIYKDGIYHQKAEVDIGQYTQEMCGKRSNPIVQKYVVNHVNYETIINRREFNKVNCDLNLLNGIYNYETGEFRKHSQDDLYTYKLNVNYNPDAKCPEIDKFFGQILSEEDTLLVQEAFAYCYVPNYRIQKYFLFIGGGDEGKGTTINLLEELLGKDNVSHADLQSLNHNMHYSQASLYGKKANLCGDIDRDTLKNTAFIKKATGNDGMQVRNIRGDPFEMVNTAKFIFSANEMPTIYDKSHGFYRRIIPIFFNQKIKNKDTNFFDKISTDEEKSGFFNALMKILSNLIEKGAFSYDKSTDWVHDMLNTHSDPIGSFLYECTIDEKGANTTKDSFYNEYKEYCISKKLPFSSPSIFGKELKGQSSRYKMKDTRIVISEKKVRCWKDIELTTNLRKEETKKAPSMLKLMIPNA